MLAPLPCSKKVEVCLENVIIWLTLKYLLTFLIMWTLTGLTCLLLCKFTSPRFGLVLSIQGKTFCNLSSSEEKSGESAHLFQMHLWWGSLPSVSRELWKSLHGGGLWHTQTHIHTKWYVHRRTQNTKQVLPPTPFQCPKLSQHDLLIWQNPTHREGLWNGCSFQPPQESAAQSSAEGWVENDEMGTKCWRQKECKQKEKDDKVTSATGTRNMAGRKMQCD